MGERIKRVRGKCGDTQEKLAELAKIDYKYLQRIEGKTPPNIKLEPFEKLAKALKVSPSKLLDFEQSNFLVNYTPLSRKW